MKTEDLIAGLARGAPSTGPSPRLAFFGAVGLAVAVGLVGLATFVDVRPDILRAAGQTAFLTKILFVSTLTLAALALAMAAARPDGAIPRSVLAIPAAALAFALLHDVATAAPGTVPARWLGVNWLACLVSIPALAALPLAAMLAALRLFAPADGARAGAAAGLLTGAIGATFYAFHCTDDSALFVATWYSLAMAVPVAVGWLYGRTHLQW